MDILFEVYLIPTHGTISFFGALVNKTQAAHANEKVNVSHFASLEGHPEQFVPAHIA